MIRTVGLAPIMSQVVRQIMSWCANTHPSCWSTESTRASFPNLLSLPGTSAFRICFENNLGNKNLSLFQKGNIEHLPVLETQIWDPMNSWTQKLWAVPGLILPFTENFRISGEHYPKLLSFKRLNIYCITAGTLAVFIYNAHYWHGGKY